MRRGTGFKTRDGATTVWLSHRVIDKSENAVPLLRRAFASQVPRPMDGTDRFSNPCT